MLNKIIVSLLCLMPTELLAYVDKYDPYWDNKGSGKDFVWYVIIGGGILLINLIIKLFKGKKD